jgi:hypothetical protein
VRAAAVAAGAVVDEGSRQSTNSWGLRGPEPDPGAEFRGIALGDSFMQGMFNGDDDTPPLNLQRTLARTRNTRVSVLNTGHIGYAPEQYFFTLKEYGEQFRPHFVVVSVCPNDFGDDVAVRAGRGDDWAEADYWLGEITQWCRSNRITCLLVPVPTEYQIVGMRRDSRYPAPVCDLFKGNGLEYFDPLEVFNNEHLRLTNEANRRGEALYRSPLFNWRIEDNHFSPAGAALWATVVAERLELLLARPGLSPKP